MRTQVTGEANETQICEALRRYGEREGFVREALFHLFSLTHVMEKPRPDILKVNQRSLSVLHSQSAYTHVNLLCLPCSHSCDILAGSFGYEESSCYSECSAGSQRLCVQPDKTGPGSRNASTTIEHRHSAPAGGHEDVSQPPTGNLMLCVMLRILSVWRTCPTRSQ